MNQLPIPVQVTRELSRVDPTVHTDERNYCSFCNHTLDMRGHRSPHSHKDTCVYLAARYFVGHK